MRLVFGKGKRPRVCSATKRAGQPFPTVILRRKSESDGVQPMQDFIRRENIALFKKRLADPRTTEPERTVLLRLLTEEVTKGQEPQLATAGAGFGIGSIHRVASVLRV